MKKNKSHELERLSNAGQHKNLVGERRFWKAFGIDQLETVPIHFEHVNLSHSSVRDSDLAYMIARVKSIEMLDLNETEITNAGIAFLTNLEQLLELRLKECTAVDNDCIDFLNKLTSLRLLYVKGTGITIDGLLRLDRMPNLRELYFSAGSRDEIQHKLYQLSKLHPGCRLVIDGTVYQSTEKSDDEAKVI